MNLPKTAKQIEDSRDYVDIDGSIWAIERRKGRKNFGQWYKKVQETVYGYKYCGIDRISLNKNVSMRVHRLVAKAFIPNDCPEHKTLVAHKNNIKSDNRVENLYWATPSENTKQAVDDKLFVNDKGFEDSQSLPVNQYSTYTNELLAQYGSISEAFRETGIPKGTIIRQCKYHRPVRKETYFRFAGDESTIDNEMIRAYDYYTDELIGLYYNTGDAESKTGIDAKVILYDLHNNRKPIRNFNNRQIYFLYRDI